jgi:thiamine kinase-like enzyme
VQYDALVERVWPGRQATVSVLGGGITNHNLKVEFDNGETYVLRIAGRDTELLGIDRSVEHQASLAAAAVGVGPEVVAFLEPEGYLVTRFVQGEIVPAERMHDPETIQRVAAALRAVHNGPPLPGRFDSFRVVEEYRSVAFAHGGTMPADYARARQLARQIERARGPAPERPCHNDLLNANFIDDGKRIRIVDWEYAGMGDVFFDLANFAVNHALEEEARRHLLASYFGAVRPEAARALELMRFMSCFREAMWGVVQQSISELDFDFKGYADEQFAHVAAIAVEPAFQAALNGEV